MTRHPRRDWIFALLALASLAVAALQTANANHWKAEADKYAYALSD